MMTIFGDLAFAQPTRIRSGKSKRGVIGEVRRCYTVMGYTQSTTDAAERIEPPNVSGARPSTYTRAVETSSMRRRRTNQLPLSSAIKMAP